MPNTAIRYDGFDATAKLKEAERIGGGGVDVLDSIVHGSPNPRISHAAYTLHSSVEALLSGRENSLPRPSIVMSDSSSRKRPGAASPVIPRTNESNPYLKNFDPSKPDFLANIGLDPAWGALIKPSNAEYTAGRAVDTNSFGHVDYASRRGTSGINSRSSVYPTFPVEYGSERNRRLQLDPFAQLNALAATAPGGGLASAAGTWWEQWKYTIYVFLPGVALILVYFKYGYAEEIV